MQDIVFFLKEHSVLFVLWIVFLFFSLRFITKTYFSYNNMIDNIQAIKLINCSRATVIDTRDQEIFKTGHIVNSVHFPLKTMFLECLQDIQIYKINPIILILNDMNDRHVCMNILLKKGFKDVYILKDGIYGWDIDHLPLTTKDK
jgi:rhodanese-related sulfurtransferase